MENGIRGGSMSGTENQRQDQEQKQERNYKPTTLGTPLSLRNVTVTDDFWKQKMELVRTEVIPYQWNALNDRIPEAAPSFCMRNFKIAGKITANRKKLGKAYEEKIWPLNTFETLPEDPEHMEERFYGFLFQDSDFAKWIEAVGYSLTQHPDPELEEIADGAIDVVCAAQQENGYLDTYYIINDMSKIFTNLRDNHELYCFGHLTEGAVAYYQATGKDKLLNAAKRYADFIYSRFGTGEGKIKGYPGHEIAEMALVRLYEATGEKKYLELCNYFLDQRGVRPYYFDKEHPEAVRKGHEADERYHYHQAHKPVREQDEAVGHAVRAVYLYSGMADAARINEDPEMFAACEKLWNNITKKKMYVTGGIGATHIGESFSFNYDLPNDTAYSETCAAIGLVFFARRMLQMKADSKYADVMERALYNGVLSGMALDGKSFFYVNPLEVVPEAAHKDERKFHVKPIRQKWFGCACCPPNIARTLSSIAGYAFTENEDTLFVHLYMGSEIDKKLQDGTVHINIEAGLPWKGNVRIRVNTEESSSASKARRGGSGDPAASKTDRKFTIACRLPGWSRTAKVHGKNLTNDRKICIKNAGNDSDMLPDDVKTEIRDGYLYLTKSWKNGEEFSLDFDMPVRFLTANTAVREDAGKLAVMRGPVVYCLEEADNGKNLQNLCIDPHGRTGEYESDVLDKKIVIVTAQGRRLADSPESEELYREYEDRTYIDTELKFVPYYAWNNRGEGEMQVWTRIGS